jgi:Mg-chelatase subunit ChlD
MREPTTQRGNIPRDSSRPDRRVGQNSLDLIWGWIAHSAMGLVMALLFFVPIAIARDVETTETSTEHVDVIFVLDNSGSMRQNDPLFLTRRAITNFASALAKDESIEGRIAVVIFDGRARLVRGLTTLESGQTDDLLEPALAELDYSGQRTNTPVGIERALYEFNQHGREGARRAIILLSDGKIDTGNAQTDAEAARWLREDLADESAASEIRIFGVAFTEAADYQLMQALASRTHARYYRAFEASQLSNVVEDVLARLAEEDSLHLSLANVVTLDTANTEPTATPPAVSAASTSDRDDSSGIGLLALVPVALLLAGGALLWRQRSSRTSPTAPPAQLLDIGGQLGDPGAVIELSGTVTRIGRDPHNDIVLEDDAISSEHAVIEISGGRYWLEDQRSTNGTRVGDQRVEPGQRVQLKGGDHIRLADIDLMFVLTGYMPGGATVFLSAPTHPPAWNEAEQPVDADSKTSVGESVVQRSDGAEADPGHEQEEGEQEEQEQDRQQIDPSVQRGQLSLLRKSDQASEDNPPARAEKAPDEASLFRQSFDYHLKMVSQISPTFASFVERAFDDELRSALVLTAGELTSKANETGRIQQKQYSFDHIQFAICGVPGEMENACDRFAESFGGFTRMLTEQLQSESFRKDRCEILAVLSVGCVESPWVSLSIVPDDGQDPRIDLLSYEFLTPEERHEIESNEFVDVSHSGIA